MSYHSKRLTIVDRYLDATLFYRYLRQIHRGVRVTLVMWPEKKRKPPEWKEFLDVSRLYAIERGSKNYRLCTNDNIHDRYLCADDQIYVLGGSIKDAAKNNNFTITKAPSSPEVSQTVAQIVSTSEVIFGANKPHP